MFRRSKKLIANWKMNPESKEEAVSLARDIEKETESMLGVSLGIAPPFPFLAPVGNVLRKVRLGAQDTFWKHAGSYTGEVSPDQIESLGASFVIEGHSERRDVLGEDEEFINKEVRTSLETGLDVILCVGEPKRVRKEGFEAVKNFVGRQLSEDLNNVGDKDLKESRLYIAYEPIWAISSSENSRAARVEEVVEVVEFIQNYLFNEIGIPLSGVFYGGSTDSDNIEKFLSCNSIDGALVGSSSLDSEEFLEMARKVNELE
ncbi:MAG: triose-phosphate isomerase [Candidatus Magasanikbacteria bacterium]